MNLYWFLNIVIMYYHLEVHLSGLWWLVALNGVKQLRLKFKEHTHKNTQSQKKWGITNRKHQRTSWHATSQTPFEMFALASITQTQTEMKKTLISAPALPMNKNVLSSQNWYVSYKAATNDYFDNPWIGRFVFFHELNLKKKKTFLIPHFIFLPLSANIDTIWTIEISAQNNRTFYNAIQYNINN